MLTVEHFRTQIESILDNHKKFDDLKESEKWSITAAYMRDECNRTYSDATLSIQQILEGLVYKNDPNFIIATLKKDLISEFQYDIEKFIENKRIHNELFNDSFEINDNFESPNWKRLNNFVREGKL